MCTLFQDADFESLLLETGYNKPLAALAMGDKQVIMSAMADYHCVLKVKAATDQFAEGIDRTGVLKYIKSHGQPLLCYTPCNLTAGMSIECRKISLSSL